MRRARQFTKRHLRDVSFSIDVYFGEWPLRNDESLSPYTAPFVVGPQSATMHQTLPPLKGASRDREMAMLLALYGGEPIFARPATRRRS